MVAIPQSIIHGTVEPYAVTGTRLIAVDPLAAQALLRTAPQSNASNVARDWTVEEKILTGYLQANFGTDLGAVPVSGNIGVQIVHTDQHSVGFGALSATTDVAQSGGDKYTNVLPSLNVNFEVARNTLLRFGVQPHAGTRDDGRRERVLFGQLVRHHQGVPTGCTTLPN